MCAGGCEGQAWAVREVFVGWQRGWGLDRDLQRQLAPVPALILGIAETQRRPEGRSEVCLPGERAG